MLMISGAIAALSTTFAKSHVLLWFRIWAFSKWEYFGTMLSCSYCMSHWFALGFIFLDPYAKYKFTVIEGGMLVNFLTTWFLLVFMSSMLSRLAWRKDA
jgi:hypothetical protein